MKVKIIEDEITRKVQENFTIENTGEVEFIEHSLPSEYLPKNFNIGLIIGKSGTGKSTLLKTFFNNKTNNVKSYTKDKAIVSCFDTYEDAEERLLGAGLSSIPSWLKPYSVLSNGEKHRADLALNIKSDMIVDEFVSYVDDESALGLSNSIQRYIRKKNYTNVVFASLNKNLVEYLQPDWIYDTDDSTLTVNSNIYDCSCTIEETKLKVQYKKIRYFMEIN